MIATKYVEPFAQFQTPQESVKFNPSPVCGFRKRNNSICSFISAGEKWSTYFLPSLTLLIGNC